ncbi:MAG: efflux RND transporter periplasmic adaptor subunit [Bacteroidales bacterium]|nr:efflux RND transporter periplasmic adaptor subunit [Bacteroidales bacterium]MBK8884849.1 efflux RND transporter periplasmic adaptor subunit [Bacteroidales bacterium]
MKSRFNLVSTILLLIVITAIIAYPKLKPLIASLSGSKNKGGMLMGTGQQVLNVSGYLIKPEKFSEIVKSTGTLRPDEEVDLSFEASGKIVSIKFTEGTRVKKGDLLAKINDRPLQAQLQKLLAQKKLTEAKEYRERSLLEKDAISQESYDQIVTELQTIEADISLIEARISETELRAPFDGIIGLRYLSEGFFATPSTKIAKLIKISPLKIEFSIPERYASEIRIGYPVTFMVDGINKSFEASVYAVDPKIDIETRTIVIRALYPNRNEELKSGRYASITLVMSQIENAASIPTEALIPEMEGEKVFIYKTGKASSQKVEIGIRTESRIQITAGLNFGDTVLTTGILQLRQNLPVVLDTLFNIQ